MTDDEFQAWLQRNNLDSVTEAVIQRIRFSPPLMVDVSALLTRWRWFGEWSMECVGILGDWTVETVEALWSESKTGMKVETLTKHAL